MTPAQSRQKLSDLRQRSKDAGLAGVLGHARYVSRSLAGKQIRLKISLHQSVIVR